MGIIDNFIKQYEREYDFYKQIARIGHDKLETEIINRGIKAMVSSRAKRVDRLKEKIEKRNQSKNYRSKTAIEKDIPDLAGIRVALYFPSDRKVLGELINEVFEVVETKQFPENPHSPKLDKRFSGYWATHYRVKIKKTEDVDKRFTESIIEIQVASVLMHAWSEVEHDLVYKPFSGKLSKDELSILDEINGLVLAGEIALERLQKAITERTAKQNEITDKYQLTTLIRQNYISDFDQTLDFGNTEYINNFLKVAKSLPTADILDSFKKIDLNIKDSFSDQILQNLINMPQSADILSKYFGQYTNDRKKISGFELFTKTWIIFEKVIFQLSDEIGFDNKKNYVPTIDTISKILQHEPIDLENIKKFRNIRNELLHGYQAFTDEELESAYQKLLSIVKKCLEMIITKGKKEEFSKELNNLNKS